MEFKIENKIKKYRNLLNISAKELGGDCISEDTIYNIENGKGSTSLVSTLIIIIKINKLAEKVGVLLNLSLKDILISEEALLIEYCKGKLNEFSKMSLDEKLYLDLLEFIRSYKSKEVERLVKLELGLRFIDVDPKKSLIYFKDIYDEYEKKVDILRYMAKAEEKLNNYEEAIRLLNKAKSYINGGALLDQVNCDIGTFLSIIREDLESRQIFEEILSKKVGEKKVEIISKINYAVVLTRLKDYEKALGIYKELLNEGENKSAVYYNISGLYKIMGDDEKSFRYLNKLIDYESRKNSEFTTYALFNLGARYGENGMYREAIVLFESSIKASKQYKNYNYSLKGYRKILEILKLQNRKNDFTQYLGYILEDINSYKDNDDKSEVLAILVDFLKEDSHEIINEILKGLQGDGK